METTIMENQMEKKMENEMDTGIIWGGNSTSNRDSDWRCLQDSVARLRLGSKALGGKLSTSTARTVSGIYSESSDCIDNSRNKIVVSCAQSSNKNDNNTLVIAKLTIMMINSNDSCMVTGRSLTEDGTLPHHPDLIAHSRFHLRRTLQRKRMQYATGESSYSILLMCIYVYSCVCMYVCMYVRTQVRTP